MNKKIAIFGGSFNPPHKGHAAVVSAIIQHQLADEIWIMPSPSRSEKLIPTPPQYRLEMVQLLIQDIFQNSAIPVKATDFEISHSKELSTYQTKLKLEQTYPSTDFLFIFGSDVLPYISTWPDGNKFYVNSKLIIIERPGAKHLHASPNVTLITDYSKYPTSSTQIRSLIHQQQDVKEFLTPSVDKYIKDKKLYL